MPRPLDPRLAEILKRYDEDIKSAAWDCHGTWVVYHAAIERIAAKAKITFEMPEVIEGRAADKIATIIVRGFMGERSEWSFGEAAPSNNKNAYPFAMAEKRGKDRVVLKLVGLHGLAYSEEESDDFKPGAQPARQTVSSASLKRESVWPEFERELAEVETVSLLNKFALEWSTKAEADRWPAAWREQAKEAINKHKAFLINGAPDDDTFPGDLPSRRQDDGFVENFVNGR